VVPTPEEAAGLVPALADILIDCVEGGASVSFLLPIERRVAEDYYQRVVDKLETSGVTLFVAHVDQELAGTVLLSPVLIENQPHRAEVFKLLVHRRARNRGAAECLMRALEHKAAELGRPLLSLDTTAGTPSERLYTKLGWQRLGVMPGHALLPDGRVSDTTFFWKQLDTPPRRC
jgi:GNAT superfamily N-acetyltransferase